MNVNHWRIKLHAFVGFRIGPIMRFLLRMSSVAVAKIMVHVLLQIMQQSLPLADVRLEIFYLATSEYSIMSR